MRSFQNVRGKIRCVDFRLSLWNEVSENICAEHAGSRGEGMDLHIYALSGTNEYTDHATQSRTWELTCLSAPKREDFVRYVGKTCEKPSQMAVIQAASKFLYVLDMPCP